MIVDGVERRVFAEDLAVEAGQLALSYRGREAEGVLKGWSRPDQHDSK